VNVYLCNHMLQYAREGPDGRDARFYRCALSGRQTDVAIQFFVK
jgi:hypothetical protein